MPDINPDNTDRVLELAAVPQGDRDAGWHMDFYKSIATAAFMVPPEEMQKGPDGFPYLLFYAPAKDEEFRAFSVAAVIDVCLEKGIGIAVFGEAQRERPIWVFTYGNLWSYKTTGQFDARPPTPAAPAVPEGAVPKGDRQVLVAAPSETAFPYYARDRVREFLKANGVAHPKVAYIHDAAAGGTPTLLFTMYGDTLQGEDHIRAMMYRMSWYFPPHVSISPLLEHSEQFEPMMVAF